MTFDLINNENVQLRHNSTLRKYYLEAELHETLKKMYAKKRELNRTDSKAEFKDVPRMTQVRHSERSVVHVRGPLTFYF